MTNNVTLNTLRDLLNLVLDPTDPLRVGTGVANYRAALNCVTRLKGMPSDLSLIPADAERVLTAVSAAIKHGATTKTIPKAVPSRLKTLFEKASLKTAVKRLSPWEQLRDFLDGLSEELDIDPKTFTPINHTLANFASAEGLTPSQVTRDWLVTKLERASAKEAASLRGAVKLIRMYHNDLPYDIRPIVIDDLPSVSGQRKSRALPPLIAHDLNQYLNEKCAHGMLEGTEGEKLQVSDNGISIASAISIEQALKWYHDCLVALGYLSAASDATTHTIARMDWVEAVVAESLADLRREPDKRRFPWKPIGAKKLENHFGYVRRFLYHFVPNIKADYMPVEKIIRVFSDLLRDEMTPENKKFCLSILSNDEKMWVVLNMHTLLFQEAKDAWRDYTQQSPVKQAQTLNLAILAAIAAIETSFPFRAHTVLNLSLFGDDPDVKLPAQHPNRVEFDVVRRIIKNRETFTGDLEDSESSRPREILDWFVAGPREEILNNAYFLPVQNRQPNLLFGGYNYKRYNETLQFHSARLGLRMKTHQWRHAIASILINLEGANIEDIAAVMNISIAVLLHRYAFIRKSLRVARGMRNLDKLRTDLNEKIMSSRAHALKNRRGQE
jgi:hypothetical protein